MGVKDRVEEVIGEVTFHEKQEGFLHYRVEGNTRVADESIVRPYDKYLPKGHRIKVTLVNGRATKIEAAA